VDSSVQQGRVTFLRGRRTNCGASSSKKDTGPTTREIDAIVIQWGVRAVAARNQSYLDHPLDEPSLAVPLSPTGNHQDRSNDHGRDEDEHNGDHQKFIQNLIKHEDPLPGPGDPDPAAALLMAGRARWF
jgi:hypothetical protein